MLGAFPRRAASSQHAPPCRQPLPQWRWASSPKGVRWVQDLLRRGGRPVWRVASLERGSQGGGPGAPSAAGRCRARLWRGSKWRWAGRPRRNLSRGGLSTCRSPGDGVAEVGCGGSCCCRRGAALEVRCCLGAWGGLLLPERVYVVVRARPCVAWWCWGRHGSGTWPSSTSGLPLSWVMMPGQPLRFGRGLAWHQPGQEGVATDATCGEARWLAASLWLPELCGRVEL